MTRSSGTASTLTVATWNAARLARPAMLDLIEGVAPDILFLQEVTAETWPIFRHDLPWSGGTSGLDLRPRGEGEGRGRSLGAAVLVRSPLALTAPRVLALPEVARPERLVAATARQPDIGFDVTVVSYHALQGRQGGDESDKPRTSERLGAWLEGQEGPVLLGMDANSPDIDHPDPQQVECHFAQTKTRAWERRLLAPDDVSGHRLRDVWRTHLDAHPRQMQSLRRYQPRGPLAITHFTGSGAVRLPRRYDHIWATPDFTVQDVRHVLAEAYAAGSDHALVWARLSYR